MKKFFLLSAIAGLLLFSTQSVFAGKSDFRAHCDKMTDMKQKGYCLAKVIDALPHIEKSLSNGTLKIYDAQGKKLFTKKLRSARYQQDYNNPEKRLTRSIAYFYAPADDKGNGSLSKEIKGEDDDQYLYLKGLRKPKRVIGSDKSSSFMGSDLSNGDVAPQDIDDYNYRWLAQEKMTATYKKGKKSKKLALRVDKTETAFKSKKKREDYGYSKSIIWANAKTGLPLRIEHYDLSGQLSKVATLKTFTIKKNRDGKKVYIPTKVIIKSVIKGTKTIQTISKLRVEKKAASLKPGVFKVDYLTRRWW